MMTEELELKLKKYETYLQSDTNNPRLLRDVAELYFALGNLEKAEHLIRHAISLNPDAGTEFFLTNILLAKGEYAESIEIIDKLKNMGYQAAAIDYNLAYAKYATHNAAESLALLESLGDELNTIPGAFMLLAKCYHYVGELEKSQQVLNDYLENDASNDEAMGMAALLNYDLGDTKKAEQWADQTLVVDDKNYDALVVKGSINLDGHYPEQAIELFNQSISARKNGGRAWSGMGLAYSQLSNWDKAIECMEAAIKASPNDRATMHSISWMYIMTNNLTAARSILERAKQLYKSFSETYGTLAVVDYSEQKFKDAETNMRKALRLDKNSFSGRFAKVLLNQKHNPKQAENLMKEIFASKPATSDKTVTELMQSHIEKIGINRGTKH